MKEKNGISNNLVLNGRQVKSYFEDGFVDRVPVFSKEKANEYLSKLLEFEEGYGVPFSSRDNYLKYKAHLLFSWVDDLIRTPALLDSVEDILGTKNIMVRATDIFVKEANDPSFISFHQDATYWGLDSKKVLTAWVALTDSNVENGVLHVIPGTHHKNQIRHITKPDEDNMLSNCQEVAEFDESDARPLELKPGEVSFHNFLTVHGSYPNRSNSRRVGVAIRYMPTDVKLTHEKADYATLVRGEDCFGNFIHESSPCVDVDPNTLNLLKQYRTVMTATAAINYGETPGSETSSA